MNLTPHQRIQATVQQIPPGRVASYGQIADLAGLPGRARMVGKALGAADEADNIPWHRVIRSDGSIAFPAGSPIATEQRERLMSEGVLVKGQRIAMRDWQWRPSLDELMFKLHF